MAGIMDYFRQKQPQPQQQQQQGQQQQSGQQGPNPQQIQGQQQQKPNEPLNTNATDFSSAGQSKSQMSGSPETSKNPLDSFAGMYHTEVKPGEENKPPVFSLDPKALQTAAQSLNFSPVITPELAQKFQSGDPVAIAEALNAVGRQVYQTSMSHQSALTDRFVDARLSHDRKGLGQSVHSVLTANKLTQLAESNPVLKEHVTEIGSKIASKYPDATPDWIAEQTKAYFVTMAMQLDPSLNPHAVAEQKAKDENINWEDWIKAGAKN